MRKRLILVMLLAACLALLFNGCATMRENIVDLSKSDIKNIDAVKEAARNLLVTWPTYSGIIQGYFEDDLGQLPGSFSKNIYQLDVIACAYGPQRYPEYVKERLSCNGEGYEPTDWELGYSLALRILMLRDSIKSVIDQFAPELLEYLPALIGLS